jgi:hypothetical protein
MFIFYNCYNSYPAIYIHNFDVALDEDDVCLDFDGDASTEDAATFAVDDATLAEDVVAFDVMDRNGVKEMFTSKLMSFLESPDS